MLHQVLDRHNPLLLLTPEQVIRYQPRSGGKNFMRCPWMVEQAMGTPWVPRNPRPIAGPAQVPEILELAA
jgi:hypothetical protein